NASAHLFLANSYDALRDPERLLLRYETAWFNELLLANLLSPVGGGPLSQFVSQQEYSQLLESDGAGGNVLMEAREGGYYDFQASLFTTTGRFSTGVDYLLHVSPGTRPNNDNRREEIYWQAKLQVSDSDLIYTLVKGERQEGGDLLLTTDNQPASSSLRFEDRQEPGLALVGWNHRWAPGIHTLFLGGRMAAHQTQSQLAASLPLILRDPGGLQPGFLRPKAGGGLEYASAELRNAPLPPVSVVNGSLVLSPAFQQTIAPFLGQGPALAYSLAAFDSSTQRQFEIYSVELQQIWQAQRHTLVAGGRWQSGELEAQALLTIPAPSSLYTAPPAGQDIATDFERRGLYVYEFLNLTPELTLVAGAAWDWMQHPENFRLPPLSGRVVENERFSSKLGFTYVPRNWITVRGAYTESLGGVSFDESVRLEPVQLAGFNQAFRTIISEAYAGSVEAPVYKNLGLNVEGALGPCSWWSLSFERLRENADRVTGAFDFLVAPIFPFPGFAVLPAGTTEQLSYEERVWTVGVNRLIGERFAASVSFRHTDATLLRHFPQVPTLAGVDTHDEVSLQEIIFRPSWNSPAGWFARAEAGWYRQDAVGTTSGSTSTDNFFQLDFQ
ncbi:MAG TPA: TonB-dependent receptor, partial [Bacteroidia bacterium]|nr:TonB-dependent receptor [Bacteroidia bacterium]